MLKRDAPQLLAAAVRTVAAGESLVLPGRLRALVADRARGVDPRQRDLVRRLTDRERDVLRLVAAGRSNAEVATELVLAVETVKTHVNRVLAKLGVRDRAPAVVAAYESGFVEAGRGHRG